MTHTIRLASFAALLGASSLAQAQTAGGRELGFAVSTAQDGDLAAAVGFAQAACMSTIHISISWNNLHPDTLSWNVDVLQDLDLINLYFASIGVKVELQIGPVNTVVDQMPADLVGLPYDDPRVVRDMERTLDSVLAHLSVVQLAALNISNESDALWGTDAAKYTQFGNFMQVVAPHARSIYQAGHGDTLSVGTTFTWFGLTDPQRAALCQTANAHSDHISVTYYPLQNDFTVKQPTSAYADVDLLLNMQPGPQPIRFAEIGYPSSATCGSSEIMQASFVTAAMDVWDSFQTRIPYMGWFLLTDWDSTTVDTLGTYYGINDPVFLEYLRTLGLRTWPGSGTDKLAYERLLCELRDRGFCTAFCADGIDEHRATLLNIAPNPATDRVCLSGARVLVGTPVHVLSMAGQEELVVPYGPEIDVSKLPPGAHMLHVEGMLPVKLMIAGR